MMTDPFGHRISYLRVSITDRCNERCFYCMPEEIQEWQPREEILSYEEITRLIRVGMGLGIRKVRITGGEPLTRRHVLRLFDALAELPGLEQIAVSTNGTLLSREDEPGSTMARSLAQRGVSSVNISLDTLDRQDYAATTGRDYLDRVLEGIEAAREAGLAQVRLNCVLMRGRSEDQILPLIEFAGARNLLIRFIELMPVSRTDVLHEDRFFPIASAKRVLEDSLGPLLPVPDFRTNGPAVYYQIPDRKQKVGFIGAMTSPHFCESCNKLRLTADGKLRPCLGSHREFDIKSELRAGADDGQLAGFFRHVVFNKPESHEFLGAWQPARKMVAIGG